jgi:hypothetical protein
VITPETGIKATRISCGLYVKKLGKNSRGNCEEFH